MFFKHIFDIILSGLALIFLLFVVLVTAIAIKLDSKGLQVLIDFSLDFHIRED